MILTLDNVSAAMGGMRLRDMDEAALIRAVGKILEDTNRMAGYDKGLFPEDVTELAGDLRRGNGRLTVDDIRLACKAGISGELGDVKKPTVANVLRWAEAYDRHPQVADARKIRSVRKEEPKPLTEAEGLAIERRLMPELTRERWEGVRVNGSFPRHCIPHVSAQIYDWMSDGGLISLPAATRRKALETARAGVGRMGFPMGHLEDEERMAVSLAKHICLERWMLDRVARGLPLDMPAEVRRIYP